ncbi:YncE family protein [Amycolatopsis sp. cg5]|uniref:YncE family protein n=1 Tax=Amycolatopsis sp. cg5 TaxID=3238802 RepID=UPI0035253F26
MLRMFAAVLASTALLAAPAQASQVISIDVGGEPTSIAVNPATGLAYVSDPSTGAITVIDSRSATVSAIIPIGGTPAGIAVDSTTNRVYVANPANGTVAVVDGGNNVVVSTISAGDGAASVGVDEAANKVYAGSRTTGAVSVIDGVSATQLTQVPGRVKSLAGIAVDSGRKLVSFASPTTDGVEVFDAVTNTFIASVPVGSKPVGVAVHRASGTIYVANSGIHHMSLVDSNSKSERKTILLRSEASSVAVHEGSNTIYTNGGPNGIVKLDGLSGALAGELPLGINPGDIAVDQKTKWVYVSDPLHGRVSLIKDF